MEENMKILQIPKELEERVKNIENSIREDMTEYGHMPSLKELSGEFGLTMEEAAECILYLPTELFCEYTPFMSAYEWEMISHISELKGQPAFLDEDEEDEDLYMMENFHFMT